MPSTGSKRFELPKLDFKFGSLTEGTNIPPPLPSPVQEVPTPPQTPRVSETKDSGSAVKEKVENKTNGHTAAVPGSPATTNEGETQSAHNRPMSRSQGSIIDEKKSKRSSGWFKRLRTSESSPPHKRSSIVYEHPNVSETSSQTQSKPQITQPQAQAQAPQVQGPPPPMIPELSALQARLDVGDGGSLGDDLFKNIK
ncbi:hypothetical protein HER10_EVM0000256 [Colletotrichum scovillei]|uniref:Uncharacterized protein n=1 Tax=Colletotrichum scovillei TaxID=1209932 RepID=A0A9P7RHH9_9PEZI|nr:uncharacterized protein HER10_EVM0000256 [Colletotrichum scovillei]KAF4779014.1 hypothetical protein HER10_EVM0000256 [Colletotrichum scovillei]KAG7058204.1 hypothetical protein JMJ77_0005582 [Colletotrichum scovillei]KAG7076804.1 hypothetical protein JMJ76_0014063 [Colletotrichum scovillei]KAG7083803.1 hypothetical protein JMJ78_0009245 [Colletotrichum scovillei]